MKSYYQKAKEEKNYRCSDCGKLLSPFKHVKRCKSCHLAIIHEKNRGERHPKWTNKTICGCGAVKKHDSKQCYKCYCKDIAENNNGVFKSGEQHRFYGLRGKNHHNYKGTIPIATAIRKSIAYAEWRNAVYKRDDYTCQECGKRGTLNAHHERIAFSVLLDGFMKVFNQSDKELMSLIQDYSPFWDLDNGITLCLECHNKKKQGRRKRNASIEVPRRKMEDRT